MYSLTSSQVCWNNKAQFFRKTSSKCQTHNLISAKMWLWPWQTCSAFKSVTVSLFLLITLAWWASISAEEHLTRTLTKAWPPSSDKNNHQNMFLLKKLASCGSSQRRFRQPFPDGLLNCVNRLRFQSSFSGFWTQKPQHDCLFSVTECSRRAVRRMLCYLYIVQGVKKNVLKDKDV